METIEIDLAVSSKMVADLEELAAIRGSNLATAVADAVAEVLLRERVDFACFRTTMASFDGLVPDGTLRVRPLAEA